MAIQEVLRVAKEYKMTFKKFCHNYIPHHPELKLGADDLTPTEEFAKVALNEGRKLGFSFTEGEIQAVLREHPQVRRKIAAPKFRYDNDVR